MGGPFDNYNGGVGVGAAWVFTRSGGVWTQQGTKLVGVDQCSCHWDQGSSVALSGDGNTVIIGARFATFVFTRSEGLWTQQGPSLSFYAELNSVALSSDGNTAIVGDSDMQGRGGVFVLTRSGSAWTLQAALVATWVFTRSGGVWTQQGNKLVGTGAVGSAQQGFSVALSGDGNTALMSGPYDNSTQIGATWVFTRSGGVWTQQGSKLIGSGAVGSPHQGWSVALSGDGNTALVGGPDDAGDTGAAWVFVRHNVAATHDFNGDGKSDIAWRDTSGNVAIWEMNGTTVLNPNTAGVGNVATTWSIVGTGDFNGDGKWDIVWRDTSGNIAIWEMNGTTVLNPNTAGVGNVATTWSVVGTGDFNGDGKWDILWRDTSGNIAIWEMNGTTVLNPNAAGVGNVTTSFKIAGSGDFNGDGKSDVLWRDTSGGNVAIWFMNSTSILNPNAAGVGNVPIIWTIQDALGG